MKCPVCEAQYTENRLETCSVCGYDLTPYPPVLGQIPPDFLVQEKKRILAAKRVWKRSQMTVAKAEAITSKFQSQLDGIGEKVYRLTQEKNQQQWVNLQSQLDELNQKIDRLTQEKSQSNFSELLLQQETKILEVIESRFKPIQDEQQKQPKGEENSWKSSWDGNYSKLNELLKSGKWKEADQETARIILAVAGKTSEGGLNLDDINKFPCEDLRIIDDLWVKYSNGRFGFSVQKQIYFNFGGKPEGNPDDSIWYKFVDEIGWRVNGSWLYSYYDFTFSMSASRGHLPSCGWVAGIAVSPVGAFGSIGEGFLQFVGSCCRKFFSRAETCNLKLQQINESYEAQKNYYEHNEYNTTPHNVPDKKQPDNRQTRKNKNSQSNILKQVINVLNRVPGMTQAHQRDFKRSVPCFTLGDGSVVKTWKNPVGVDHVFIADKNGNMVFAGFVGWIHSEGLHQAIAQIQKDFT